MPQIMGNQNQINTGIGKQVMMHTEDQREIEHLKRIVNEKEQLIVEKERLIQILLKNNPS